MYTIAVLFIYLFGIMVLCSVGYIVLTVSYCRYQNRRNKDRIRRKAVRRLADLFEHKEFTKAA